MSEPAKRRGWTCRWFSRRKAGSPAACGEPQGTCGVVHLTHQAAEGHCNAWRPEDADANGAYLAPVRT